MGSLAVSKRLCSPDSAHILCGFLVEFLPRNQGADGAVATCVEPGG